MKIGAFSLFYILRLKLGNINLNSCLTGPTDPFTKMRIITYIFFNLAERLLFPNLKNNKNDNTLLTYQYDPCKKRHRNELIKNYLYYLKR